METLLHEASAFWFTWNKTEESHSSRRAYLSGICRLRFSFFANDQPVPYGAPAEAGGASWVWFQGL
jgi:hypothetical protein